MVCVQGAGVTGRWGKEEPEDAGHLYLGGHRWAKEGSNSTIPPLPCNPLVLGIKPRGALPLSYIPYCFIFYFEANNNFFFAKIISFMLKAEKEINYLVLQV